MNKRNGGGSLWITRMCDMENDEELHHLVYAKDGARAVFYHLVRLTKKLHTAQGKDWLREGDLIVTLFDANGNAEDDPIRIPAAQADWFLSEWLKVENLSGRNTR